MIILNEWLATAQLSVALFLEVHLFDSDPRVLVMTW